MAYHDDLLTQALQLVRVTPASQLSLRRAVSAAYYAVFHFLIADLDPVELTQVKSAEKIFTLWPAIRGEQIAQAYLVSVHLTGNRYKRLQSRLFARTNATEVASTSPNEHVK
jgi:hypothetical protein